MGRRDVCEDLAAILIPLSTGDSEEARGALLEEQGKYAGYLEVVSGESGDDLVLNELQKARRRKLQAEEEIRLLIAYARESFGAQPYKLIDLAEAAGLSTTGVRIAYNDEDVEELSSRIGRRLQLPSAGRRGVRTGNA